MKVLLGEIGICVFAFVMTIFVAPEQPKIWGAAWALFFAYHFLVAMPALYGKDSRCNDKCNDELFEDGIRGFTTEELNPYNVNDPNNPML